MLKKLVAVAAFVLFAWFILGIIPTIVPHILVYGIAIAAGLAV